MTTTNRIRRRQTRAFVLLGALALAATVLFVPGAFSGDGDAEAEDIVIALKDSIEIEDFLKAVGAATREPLVWDPQDKQIRGKQIIGALDIRAPAGELMSVVRALLTFYELVMIPVGPEGYQVQLVMDARRTTSILKLKAKYVKLDETNLGIYENADGLYITTTIRVENMSDLRNARNALTRVVTGQNIGNVTEVPDANAFVITDFAPNVVSIYRLLSEMDVKPEGREVTSEYIALEHATADEIEPVITDLFTGRERVTQPGRPRPNNQGGSTAVQQDPEPRIIADTRTNQIIVYATRSDIAEIRKVVEHLDVPLFIVTSYVHVIRLKNLEADETAEVLSTLIESSTLFGSNQGVTTTQPGGRANAPPGASSDPRNQEKPAVVADIKSNSLIIAATERQYDQLKRIIEEIDIKKSQVLIEAALVELTLEDAYELSVELGGGDDAGLTGDSVSGFGFTNYGQNVFADKDGDTYFTDRIPAFVDSPETGAPRGLVGGIFYDGGVPLIFSLLNTVSRTRILQMPSVVTADNEEAVIEVLDRQATTTSTTTTGGVTNGGFGGFQDAGTTLRISPHIADDHYLLLNISLTVSAFTGEERVFPNGTVIPANQINRVLTTVVTVENRHTVVLGGLMGRNQASTVERVPVVSDLPILGDLFQSTGKSNRETSLFLFVTPTIMSGDEDGFKTLDIESCKRKNKADELIGYTEIWNSNFVGCEFQDPSSGFCGVSEPAMEAPLPAVDTDGCISGSGSASDRLEEIGVLQQTRFHNVSRERLEAERAARRQQLMGR